MSFSTFAVFCLLCLAGIANAETWTDQSGKYQVAAEFVGVEGRSVVLRKIDGSTVKVPIDRLSAESRAQAKRLYEMSKSRASVGADAPPADGPGMPSSLRQSPDSPKLNFTPPEPPPVAPMPAFPENASLQATFDFVTKQILAGHPEVLWHALPKEVRTTFDSEEMRIASLQSRKAQRETTEQMVGVALKALEVLVTKKQFVLNSPIMAQVPPPAIPMIQQGYDPAVGAIFELAMTFASADEEMEKMTITEIVDQRGPQIGGHLKSLLRLVPPEMVDGLLSRVTVQQTSDTTGTISTPNGEGGADTTEMVKLMGRWVPKDFAIGWALTKDNLKAVLSAPDQDADTAQKNQMMAGMMATMANGVLDPMLAARSQEEFDQAVMQVVMMMQGMAGGGDTPLSAVPPSQLDIENKSQAGERDGLPSRLQALEKLGARIYQFEPGQFSVEFKQPSDAGLSHLKGMTNLTGLGLGDPNEEGELSITDAGLEHLKGLTALTSLTMYQPAPITDAGVKQLSGLKNLKHITIESTRITDASLAQFEGMTNLNGLILGVPNEESELNITDAGLVHLRGLKALTQLNIYQTTRVTDAGLECLSGLTELKLLSLQSRGITDTGLEHLKTLKELKLLSLSGTNISDAGLEHIGGFTQLETLSLVNTDITDAGLANLSGLTKLKMLSLTSTNISDAGLAHLKTLRNLGMVMAPGTSVTAAGAAKLKQSLPKCMIFSNAGVF